MSDGLGKRQIAQFIEDQEVEAGDEIGGSSLAFCAGLGIQFVHQVDHIEEPTPAALPDAGSSDADGKMGFAGACASDQDKVALVIQEVARGQVADQRLVDLRRLEVELFQFLGQRQLGDRHLNKIRPPDLRNRLHNQHPQLAPSNPSRKLLNRNIRGVTFGRRLPQYRGQSCMPGHRFFVGYPFGYSEASARNIALGQLVN